jgi:hypothetical protein
MKILYRGKVWMSTGRPELGRTPIYRETDTGTDKFSLLNVSFQRARKAYERAQTLADREAFAIHIMGVLHKMAYEKGDSQIRVRKMGHGKFNTYQLVPFYPPNKISTNKLFKAILSDIELAALTSRENMPFYHIYVCKDTGSLHFMKPDDDDIEFTQPDDDYLIIHWYWDIKGD